MKKQSGFSFALLLFLLLLITAARVAIAMREGITASEAYYWLLSQRWEWASFSGPGGLPAIVAILTGFFGPEPLVLRSIAPLAIFVGSLGFFWWGCSLSAPRLGCWLAIAWNCLPAINSMALSFSPDPLALMFWVWFCALVSRAANDPADAPVWWTLAACVAAAGVLVSYTLLLAPGGVLLFRISDSRLWPLLFRRRPASRRTAPLWHPLAYLSIFLPIAALTGPLLWHQRTAWVAFAGQTFWGMVEFGASRTWDSLLLTLREGGFVFPALGFLVVPSIVACAITASRAARWQLAFTLPAFFWMLLQIWRGRDAELAMLFFLSAGAPAILAGNANFPDTAPAFPRSRFAGFRRILRALSVFALPVATAASVVLLFEVQQGNREPDWRQIAERMHRVAHILQVAGEPPLFFVAGDAEIAAGAGFQLVRSREVHRADFPPVFVKESQNLSSQFGLWPRYDEFVDAPEIVLDELFQEQRGYNPNVGRSAVYIGNEAPEDLPQVITNGFTRVTPVEELFDVPSGRSFYLYLCEDYRTAPL